MGNNKDLEKQKYLRYMQLTALLYNGGTYKDFENKKQWEKEKNDIIEWFKKK